MDFKNISEETRDYIRALIECIDDGIFITDGEGNVIDLNEESLGLNKREDIVGRNMRDLVKEGIYKDSVALHVIREKRPISVVQHEETKLVTTAIPFMEDGEVKMVVCCERPIRELESLQAELKETKEESLRYEEELRYIREKTMQDVGVIIESDAMMKVVDLAVRAAEHDSRVLIEGETGTGKEVVAKLIYRNGKRANKPYVAVNCGALPESLLESELFGYEKGAFTGALEGGKKGYFELANGGVLFLDEIGEVSTGFQTKLLRAIQENEIYRIGGSKPIKTDVQIIAATNQDLAELVEEGRFRADLYYRLNILPIRVPPLRERKEDIVPLAVSFIDQLNERYSNHKHLSKQALRCMCDYDWPGNVRELNNFVERLYLISAGDVIQEEDVTPILFGSAASTHKMYRETATLKENMEMLEAQVISRFMEIYKKPADVEAALGISRATLNRKISKYGLTYK